MIAAALIAGLRVLSLATSLQWGVEALVQADEAKPEAAPPAKPPDPPPAKPAEPAPMPQVVGPDDKPIDAAPPADAADSPAAAADAAEMPSPAAASDDEEDDDLPHPPPAISARVCIKSISTDLIGRLATLSPGLGARGTYSSEWFIRLDERGRTTGVVAVQPFTEDTFAPLLNEAFKKPFRVMCHGVYFMRLAWTPEGWWLQFPKGRRN